MQHAFLYSIEYTENVYNIFMASVEQISSMYIF